MAQPIMLNITWEATLGCLALVGAFWASLVWMVNKILENFKNTLLLVLREEFVSERDCLDRRQAESIRIRNLEERV